MVETWKDVSGYEGIYQVSDSGQVKSLDRKVGYRIPGFKKRVAGRILKLAKRNGGYEAADLCKNGERKTFAVHRLVATAFIGPANGREVNHKNGHKADNRARNLEWITHQENQRHSVDALGNLHGQIGEQNHGAKLNNEQVNRIRDLYAGGKHSQYKLAHRFGVARTTIQNIVERKTWKHI